MPRRKANSIRRRHCSNDLTSEAMEVLITGEIQNGCMIALHERSYPFKNKDEARVCWEHHYKTVLRILKSGKWDYSLGPANDSLLCEIEQEWHDTMWPWAQIEFGIPGETPAKGT